MPNIARHENKIPSTIKMMIASGFPSNLIKNRVLSLGRKNHSCWPIDPTIIARPIMSKTTERINTFIGFDLVAGCK